jgi:hypothetical protein
MKSIKFIAILLVAILWFANCNTENKYDISQYIHSELQDSLLTDIIIYTYKLPRGVRKENKFDPEHRHLYKKILSDFEITKYFVDEGGFHYFLIIRPARSAHGHKRGLAGKFRLTEDFVITDFEEIFNTPMLPVETIRERTEYLWADLMHYKNVDRYYINKDYIEFPNEECKYDKVLKEWVY